LILGTRRTTTLNIPNEMQRTSGTVYLNYRGRRPTAKHSATKWSRYEASVFFVHMPKPLVIQRSGRLRVAWSFFCDCFRCFVFFFSLLWFLVSVVQGLYFACILFSTHNIYRKSFCWPFQKNTQSSLGYQYATGPPLRGVRSHKNKSTRWIEATMQRNNPN
jgi:hypothetical protein